MDGTQNPVKGSVFTVNALFVAVLSVGFTARLSKLNWVTSPQIAIVESCASLNVRSFSAVPGRSRWRSARIRRATTISAGQSAIIRADYTGTRPWSIRWSDGVWQYNIQGTWVTRTVTPSATTTYTAVEVRDPSNCLGTSTGSAAITVQ